jgi:E3 ubiquitin-protein ligase BOI and related proteins
MLTYKLWLAGGEAPARVGGREAAAVRLAARRRRGDGGAADTGEGSGGLGGGAARRRDGGADRAAAGRGEGVAGEGARHQATAAAQAQRARRCKAEEDEGAAGSCFVDPDQLVVEVAAPARPCRTCGRRSSSVVLLPCRHLCVCAACEPAVSPGGAAACPMCRGAVTGTLQVFFS